jgi:hypothetical protein
MGGTVLKPDIIVEPPKITLAHGDTRWRAVNDLPEGLEVHDCASRATQTLRSTDSKELVAVRNGSTNLWYRTWPMSKRRKQLPKVTPPPVVQAQGHAVATFGERKDIEAAWTRVLRTVGLIGGGLAFVLTCLHFWPQTSVEPTLPADVSNPLSAIFRITNENYYGLSDVAIEVSLRCATIGRGIDVAPPERCDPSMHTTKKRWTKHDLGPHEPYEISPGDLLFVTPGALLYAQVSIFVSFEPWIIPFRLTKEARFETRRRSDGAIEWLHIPADGDSGGSEREKTMPHAILSWAGAIASIIAALFWIISASTKVISEGTSGWGALIGGYLVVPGPKGERVDLTQTLQKQWRWNKWAAITTAVAAVLLGVAPLF